MAITKYVSPSSTTPSTLGDDYNKQVAIQNVIILGLNFVSLTPWDSGTGVPSVAAGSVLESNGELYLIDTNTSIDDSSISDGTVYLLYNDAVSGSELFEWTNTAPTWNTAKNGWYSSGGYRFTGHIATYASATPTYSNKRQVLNWNNGLSTTFPIGGW
jgi:hypothetical protein